MKTKLEDFSEKVASATLGLPVDQFNTNVHGIDIATITAIIQAVGQIVAMFQNCPTPPKPATIANPSWVQKLQFRLLVRKVVAEHPNPKVNGLSSKVAEACFAQAGKMTADEITQVLDETDAITNYLI